MTNRNSNALATLEFDTDLALTIAEARENPMYTGMAAQFGDGDVLTALGDAPVLPLRFYPRYTLPPPGARPPMWVISERQAAVFQRQAAEALRGVLVWHTTYRRFYPGAYDPQATDPAACISQDTRIGVGKPGGACRECPHSRWGSEGKLRGNDRPGQACGVREIVFIQEAGALTPTILDLTGSSSDSVSDHFIRSLQSGINPTQGIWEWYPEVYRSTHRLGSRLAGVLDHETDGVSGGLSFLSAQCQAAWIAWLEEAVDRTGGLAE